MDATTTANNTTTQVDTTQTNPTHTSDTTNRPRNNRRRRPPQANTDRPNDSTQAGDTDTRPPQRQRNQNPRPPRDVGQRSRQDQSTADDRPLQPPRRRQGGGGGGDPRQPRPRRSNDELPPSGAPSETPSSSSRPASRNNRPKKRNPAAQSADNNPSSSGPPRQEGNSRRAKFGSTLTQPPKDGDTPQDAASTSKPSSDNNKRTPKPRRDLPQGDDLTSTLTRALSTPPYPDCPICFNSIRPDQAIWSCSPLLPIIVSDVQVHAQYCWSSFHIKCIRSWAEKNVKDVADAWRARGEPDKKGDWRCPGCQGKREVVPHGYHCFCGSTLEPKPLRMSTPHSCGSSCSRVRESGCGHPCPLRCHPGPCPPCQVTTQLECYCPRKSVLTFRCGTDSRGAKLVQKVRDLSCGQTCGRTLNCGTHTCERVCHDGDCGTCEVKEADARCFCGKDKKDAVCGRGEKVQCFVEGEEPWIGRFSCEQTCERPFDCGIHKCQKPCHVPSAKPPPCPRSPSKIAYCPCGRNAIAPSDAANPESGQYAFPARSSCTSPIPTCSNPCSKPHPACGHLCRATCHEGPCPPCYDDIVRPCRCGATTKKLPCFRVSHSEGEDGQKEILCDKPCMALRACGKHQCRRVCCPLASLAGAGGGGKKGKKSQRAAVGMGLDEADVDGWHECDLVCGKTLSCGLHQCEMKDHKGPCRPCLRSSFEEMVCPCGRTVYEPPIPCGTVMQCHYPCPLPPASSCGHSGTPHSCHPVGTPCPPCVFLTTKLCACGKNRIPNVKCSLDREMLNCGTVCGKLMACGFHSCEKRCHPEGECGSCTAVCGKARKSCLPEHHPCPLPCHAPSSCPETTPCFTPIVLTCPCGRIKHSVPCGRTSSSPPLGSSSSYTHPGTPKCTSECQIAKRNARLAEALGINTDRTGSQSSSAFGGQGVTYSDDVVNFATANPKFLALVEKTFADFINGTGVNTGAIGGDTKRKTQVLPHMPVEKRKFVHDLAAVYRMDTLMIDQEPHRSVQLIRRLDSRIPTPLLSAHLASTSTAAASSLGKLRGLAGTSASSWRTGVTPGTGSSSTTAGSASTSGPSIVSVSSSRGWAPVPVNKPVAPSHLSASGGQSGAGSRTASPGPGLMKVAGATGSSALSTPPSSLSTLPIVSNTTAAPAGNDEDVPESWEDDV